MKKIMLYAACLLLTAPLALNAAPAPAPAEESFFIHLHHHKADRERHHLTRQGRRGRNRDPARDHRGASAEG
jgi:hypothetical protein